MKLNLDRDIVFFDIESTGLNVMKDRIVQIALIKHKIDGSAPEEIEYLVNPGIPISPEAMAVHGITPEDVKNKPTFQQISKELFDWIGNSDLGGYNSDRFDIPMLMEEFARVGLELTLDNRRHIDVQRIFYKMQPRTLKAAYKYYCDAALVDAHDALADVRATVDVFKGQIKMYDGVDYEDGDGFVTEAPIKNNMEAIYQFTTDTRMLDATQRLKYDNDGTVVFNFGKYIGKPVAELLYNDKQYYNWILNKDFSTQVKHIVRRLVKEYEENLKKKGNTQSGTPGDQSKLF